MHADHHLGLLRVLRHYATIVGKEGVPLQIMGPTQLYSWIREFTNSADVGLVDKFSFLDNKDYTFRGVNCFEVSSELKLRTVLVKHCYDAYGVRLDSADGWSIVYSGDTEPCDDLIECGNSTTVLIHEATLEDGLEEDAAAKRHSTFTQALNVAKNMKAYRTILTHFSQRYPKLSPSLTNCDDSLPFVLASDFMEIELIDLEWLHAILPALGVIYEDSPDEDAISM
jgi:ribonuclease Z